MNGNLVRTHHIDEISPCSLFSSGDKSVNENEEQTDLLFR